MYFVVFTQENGRGAYDRASLYSSHFKGGLLVSTHFFTVMYKKRKLIHTDKKENKIFLIYKEIQKKVVAKSYIYTVIRFV